MRCIILLNQKGGVAKTTSTYNLAAAIAMNNSDDRILMIDLDPQASLTIACGIEPGMHERDVCDLFEGIVDPMECVTDIPALDGKLDNLYLIPSDIDLAQMESQLLNKFNRERKLKIAVEKLAPYFDYIFIDCPPQLGQLSINAIVAADEVIIPCKTDYLSYRGLQALLDTIYEIRDEELNENIKLDGIIGTIYEANTKDQRSIYELLSNDAPMLGTVRKSADISRKVIEGVPVVLGLPKSKTAEEYQKIAAQITNGENDG